MWAGERVMNWLISAAPVFIPANVGQRTCIAHQNWACKSVICRPVSSYAFWIGSRCWQIMNRHSKTLAILDFVACVADMMFKRSKANLRHIYNTPFSSIQKLARSRYFLMVSFLRSRRFWRSLVTMSECPEVCSGLGDSELDAPEPVQKAIGCGANARLNWPNELCHYK